MSGFTAKVRLTHKSDTSPVSLSFMPDYAEGRNAAWAAATPSLSLSMTVKDEIAAGLEVGTNFTLTFEPEQPEQAGSTQI